MRTTLLAPLVLAGASFAQSGALDTVYYDYPREDGSLGGGRLTLGNREAQIFGQFLAGYEHYRGLNDVVLQPGVGLDIRITSLLNLRGQFDVRTVRVEADEGRVNFTDLRAWVGISLPF